MRYSTFVNKVMYSQKTPKKLAFYLQCVLVYIHWFGGSWGQGGGWYSKCHLPFLITTSPNSRNYDRRGKGSKDCIYLHLREILLKYICIISATAPMYAIEIHTTFQRKIFSPV